jgi:hypothetical protein
MWRKEFHFAVTAAEANFACTGFKVQGASRSFAAGGLDGESIMKSHTKS